MGGFIITEGKCRKEDGQMKEAKEGGLEGRKGGREGRKEGRKGRREEEGGGGTL
jgi:hypothetical protein